MKSNKWTKLLALVLALVMVFGVMAGCSKDEPDTKPSTTTPDDTTPSDTTDTDTPPEESADEGGDTLVVGYANFSQKFSPFFATTAYDQDAQTLTDELTQMYPDCDVDMQMGGQPLYYYLVSVE